jgi:hypothetical protein
MPAGRIGNSRESPSAYTAFSGQENRPEGPLSTAKSNSTSSVSNKYRGPTPFIPALVPEIPVLRSRGRFIP